MKEICHDQRYKISNMCKISIKVDPKSVAELDKIPGLDLVVDIGWGEPFANMIPTGCGGPVANLVPIGWGEPVADMTPTGWGELVANLNPLDGENLLPI
jgi:hypothetical protein